MSIITLTPEQIARRELIQSFRDKYSTVEEFRALYPNDSRELELLDQIHDATQARKREDEQYTELMCVGKCAANSIRCMVAALNCDYERLEELRDERDTNLAVVAAYAEKMEDWQANADAQAALDELAELESQAGDCTSRDEAEQRIQEDALEVTQRDGWYPAGHSPSGTEEFCILLSTGGPATRIMGELRDGEPHRAWLQVQDWGTPWTDYHEDGLSAVLLAYARCFYFGEC